MMDGRDLAFWFCGVLTGLTVGVGAGVLFAPQSGRRTRRRLRRTAEDVQDRLEEAAEEITERGRGFVDRKKKNALDAAFQAGVRRAAAANE